MAEVRRLTSLNREESLRLLGSVPVGRVVFTHLALPAIRLVNHIVEGDKIIVRSHYGVTATPVFEPGQGTVVAYEADLVDAKSRLGWSVMVVGRTQPVTKAQEIARYAEALQPWAADADDDIFAIQAEMVDGFRLVQDERPQE